MQSQELKKYKLPEKPGVYFFLKGKDILYIGKATSLKDRTKSYFSKDLINTRGPLILDMVFKADGLKWQETETVLEALILEANLIKKHQPYYNTKEKDDKSFNYVCITRDEMSKVLIIRGRNLEQKNYAKVFGPFPNGGQLKEALRLIRKIFPFLDEKSKVKGTHEFYKQIKLVPEQKEILFQNIKNIKLLFEGKKKSILKNLEKEMKSYAKEHSFEKAGEIKRQIFALQHIQDVSLIKEERVHPRLVEEGAGGGGPKKNHHLALKGTPPQKGGDENSPFRIEAYDIAHMSGQNMVGVMVVLEDGEIAKNEYRKFIIKGFTSSNDVGALSEVLTRRFKHSEWAMPDLIVVDGSTAQVNAAKKILKEYNLNIPISAVVKDDRHKAKMILFEKFQKNSLGPWKGVSQTLGNLSETSLKKQILLANSEAHRFAITYYRQKSRKNMLK
ncbi:MAG: GIY-YIG nuclease family protein [Candidatus Nomurabacteria bacterium]|nr:GIY-YIG nuclease family protein [Candidatus Nomurabacteria bacterium]